MRRLVTSALAIAAAATGILGAAPSAQAAPGSCGTSQQTVGPDTVLHVTWNPIYFCDSWLRAPIYAQPDRNSQVIGYMYAGRNWYVCQQFNGTPSGANPPTSSGGQTNRNHWWLYTQGDEVAAQPGRQAWGFVPATYITQGGQEQPVPGVHRRGCS
jgi:hypothetical protein